MAEDQIFNPARTAKRLSDTMQEQLATIRGMEKVEKDIEALLEKRRKIYFGDETKKLGDVNWNKGNGLFALQAQYEQNKLDMEKQARDAAFAWVESQTAKAGKKPTEGQIADYKDSVIHVLAKMQIDGKTVIAEMQQEAADIDAAIKLYYTVHSRMDGDRVYFKQMAEHATLLEAGQHSVGMQLGEDAP